jgi:hypothetical protein
MKFFTKWFPEEKKIQTSSDPMIPRKSNKDEFGHCDSGVFAK